jgi:hypothetical protein
MVMTVAERLGRLEAQVAKLTQLVEAKLSPPAPKPQTPATPPAWAAQNERTGVLWSGPPSVAQVASGESWVRERKENGDWKDPSGQWRSQTGELIVKPFPHPIGPERTSSHQTAIDLLDRLIEKG